MAQQINTIIVLRNDTKAAWEAEGSYILQSGEVGVGYMSRTVKDAEGNDVVKQVPIMKLGDGVNPWSKLPQAEGVFESDVILTSAFGRHTIPNTGYKNAGGAGMTTSEWLLDALSEVKDPTVTYPTASLSASFTQETNGTGEVGTYLVSATATGSSTDGKYQYGTNTNNTANSKANTVTTWTIKDKDGNQIALASSGTVTFAADARPQLTDTATTYAFSAIATLSAAAEGTYIPLNNVGAQAAHKKITGFDASGTNPKDLTATASLTGYRKPFWGWKDTANSLADPKTITAAQIRALDKSGSSVGALPTSLEVPAGTKQLFFAAKAGTKSTLAIKNTTKEPATSVACTKVAGAVMVPGANNYGWDEEKQAYTTDKGACSYDIWFVNLDSAFSDKTKLTLTWA